MSLLDLTNYSTADLNLSDKTYLVTGAANGIGKALALSLSALKATVILLDKDATGLNSVYDEIHKTTNGEPIIVHQDLTLLSQTHCDTLASQIQQSIGHLSGLIHCAAETGHLSPIEHYSDEDWSNVINANLHAPYMLTRALVPLLSPQHQTAVIFTLSEQAKKSTAFWGAFAVAQQGLKALVETWSAETENGNCSYVMLDPGKVNTEFLVQLFPGLNAKNYPTANMIAQAYVFLLSNRLNVHGRFLRIKDLQLHALD